MGVIALPIIFNRFNLWCLNDIKNSGKSKMLLEVVYGCLKELGRSKVYSKWSIVLITPIFNNDFYYVVFILPWFEPWSTAAKYAYFKLNVFFSLIASEIKPTCLKAFLKGHWLREKNPCIYSLSGCYFIAVTVFGVLKWPSGSQNIIHADI